MQQTTVKATLEGIIHKDTLTLYRHRIILNLVSTQRIDVHFLFHEIRRIRDIQLPDRLLADDLMLLHSQGYIKIYT